MAIINPDIPPSGAVPTFEEWRKGKRFTADMVMGPSGQLIDRTYSEYLKFINNRNQRPTGRQEPTRTRPEGVLPFQPTQPVGDIQPTPQPVTTPFPRRTDTEPIAMGQPMGMAARSGRRLRGGRLGSPNLARLAVMQATR